MLAAITGLADPTLAAPASGALDGTVDAAARALMRQYDVPGLAIALSVDGERRFYNYGVVSKDTRDDVTSDTLFEIGSISKTLTATLAAEAEAEGRLSLGDSPSRYLPALRGSRLDDVTLIHLATHTAGGFPLQLPDEIRNGAQLTAYFKRWQPAHAPGTQRTYANPSIGLLGQVVAASMNVSFADAVEHHLLPALGMLDTYIDVPAARMARYAQGYDKDDAPVRVHPGVLAAEAYGVKTTARDLIRFLEINLDPARADKNIQRAVLATRTGYYRLGPMTQDLIWEQYAYPVPLPTLLAGSDTKWVYESNPVVALDPPQPPQRSVWVHKTGGTNGFSAYVAFVPAQRVGIAILANKNYPIEPRIRLAHLVLTQLACCSRAGARPR
jgi:beta-lactamase class C